MTETVNVERLDTLLAKIEKVAALSAVPLKDDEPVNVVMDVAELRRITEILALRQSDTRIEGGGWREFRPEEDLPPTGQVEVRWRDADIASSGTAINDAAAIGWQYVSWWRPATPSPPPVNISPTTEHVEGDVLSVGEMEKMLARVSPPAVGWHAGLPTVEVHAALTELIALRRSLSAGHIADAGKMVGEMEALARRLRDYRPPALDPAHGREHHPICDEAADALTSAANRIQRAERELASCGAALAQEVEDRLNAEAQLADAVKVLKEIATGRDAEGMKSDFPSIIAGTFLDTLSTIREKPDAE